MSSATSCSEFGNHQGFVCSLRFRIVTAAPIPQADQISRLKQKVSRMLILLLLHAVPHKTAGNICQKLLDDTVQYKTKPQGPCAGGKECLLRLE